MESYFEDGKGIRIGSLRIEWSGFVLVYIGRAGQIFSYFASLTLPLLVTEMWGPLDGGPRCQWPKVRESPSGRAGCSSSRWPWKFKIFWEGMNARWYTQQRERDAEEDFEFSHHANIYAGSRMSGQIDALACTPPARILVFLMKLSVQKYDLFSILFLSLSQQNQMSRSCGATEVEKNLATLPRCLSHVY